MGGLFGTSETPPALPSYTTANPRIRRGYGASSTQQANNWNDFPGYAAYNRQYFTSDDDSEKADGGTEYHGNDFSSFIFPSSDDADTQLQDELSAMSASQEDSIGTVVHHSGVSVATPVMSTPTNEWRENSHIDHENYSSDIVQADSPEPISGGENPVNMTLASQNGLAVLNPALALRFDHVSKSCEGIKDRVEAIF